MEAFTRACDDRGPIDGWWRAVDAYRTAREPLMNAGKGLVLFALSAEFLRVAMLFPSRRAWPRLRTPSRPWMFVPIGLGTIMLGLTGAILGLVQDQQAYSFPACADTMAIPIAGLLLLTLILCPLFILVGYMVQRAFGRLPVSMWHWNRSRPYRSLTTSALFDVPALCIGAWMAVFITTSSCLFVPCGVLAIYLLASTRAGLLAPRHP